MLAVNRSEYHFFSSKLWRSVDKVLIPDLTALPMNLLSIRCSKRRKSSTTSLIRCWILFCRISRITTRCCADLKWRVAFFLVKVWPHSHVFLLLSIYILMESLFYSVFECGYDIKNSWNDIQAHFSRGGAHFSRRGGSPFSIRLWLLIWYPELWITICNTLLTSDEFVLDMISKKLDKNSGQVGMVSRMWIWYPI